MVAAAMNQALNAGPPIQQSYYGTESYSICTYRLDDSFFIATTFGSEVREGQVWYAMREAATGLKALLASAEPSMPAGRTGTSDSWRDEIEQYFTGVSADGSRRRRSTRGEGTQATATPTFDRPLPEPPADTETEPVQATPNSDLPSVGQIDWDIPTDENWDQLVAEHNGTFEGIDLEEAQRRGLYTPQAKDDQPSLDDIDWEAEAERTATDLDWDQIVAGADQGFGGMNLEEAKRRGLIDDLERE